VSDWNPATILDAGRNDSAARDQKAKNEEASAAMLAMSSRSFANVLDDQIGARHDDAEKFESATRRHGTDNEPTTRRSDDSRDSSRVQRNGGDSKRGDAAGVHTPKDHPQTDKAEQSENPDSESVEADSESEETQKSSEQLMKELESATGHQNTAQGTSTGGSAGSAVVGPAGAIRLAEGWRSIQAMAQQAKAESNPSEQQQPAQIRSQVLQAIQQAEGLSDGKGVIKLQLDPAHLGKVEITIQRNGGQLDVTFKVESAEAEQALRERSSELGQTILGKGSSWNEVNVTIENESDEEDAELQDSTDEQDPEHEDEPSDQDEQEPEQDEGEGR